MRNRERGRILKSTSTTLEIVDTLVELDGARVTELADELEISKSTVCNHLHTLQNSGYATLHGDVYYPSLKFAYVGEHAIRRDSVYEITIEIIRDLAEETPFETSFTVEENGIGRFLTPEVNYPERYDKYAYSGNEVYLHTSAGGKSILAALPEQEVHDIIDRRGLPRVTDETITSKSVLFEELDRIRERGYAINESESRPDVYFIGKSVQRPEGTVHGGISIGGQIDRIRKDEFRIRIANLLDEYVDLLEQRIETTVTERTRN